MSLFWDGSLAPMKMSSYPTWNNSCMKLLITLPCLALSTPIHFKLKFKPIWNGMATQTYSLKDKSNWAIHIDAVQEFTATSNALL